VKRLLVFFIFPLLIACQIPTAVELRGNPELHFSTQMNMGSMFAEQLEDGFDSSDDSSLIPCVNTSNYTYIIHNDLFNDHIDLGNPPEGGSDFKNLVFDTPLAGPKNLINPAEPKSIPLPELNDFLDGFIFHNTKAYLFISGTDVITKFCLGISVNGGAEEKIEITASKSSGSETWSNGYFSISAPPGGHPISLDLNRSDVSIKYRVYAEKNKTFHQTDFDEKTAIKLELVIWLPMEFSANRDGAEIMFPSFFFGEDDLFGRDSPDGESVAAEIIQSLSIIIKLNTNPFLGKDLVISNREKIVKREEIKTNSLNIVFDEKDMVFINAPVNFPFTPTFKVAFDRGEILKIPKLFNATELIISARIKSTKNLNESD